ncbi:MAG: DNA-3-methyladenine glycosylase 2 family protein [Bacteroidetes bacterium]|nr:DNA-3-methyladenine glycosylase 2 family protein [Bacteroidota bacterium]
MQKLLTSATHHLKQNDKVLKQIIIKTGDCTLTPSKTYFQNLVKAIISQQLSTKAAATIHRRFIEKLENEITPLNILKLKQTEFREAGISIQKIKYLTDLSRIFIEDSKIIENIHMLTDEQIIQELTKIKGVGIWTAQMFLIFSLNRLDVLPLEDVGFKNSVKLHYGLKHEPDKETLLKLSKKWGNYKSIAVWYLWQALDNK